MSNITKEQMIEALKSMTAIELKELVSEVEKEFGVTAAVPVAQGANVPTEAPTEAKKASSVFLKAVGPKKMDVIKLVKNKLGKDLLSSKQLVDSVTESNSVLLKDGISEQEIKELKEAFEALGAVVETK